MTEPIQVPSAGAPKSICPSCGKTDKLLWPEGCNNVWHREGMVIVPQERITALETALRLMLKYCPLSGDIALMVRGCQGGGQEAAERADALVNHYQHLDEAQDEARKALEAK